MKLREMHVGRGTTRAGLTVFPVWTPVAVPNPGYVTAAHASLSVSEMPGGASVGRLQVENRGSRSVLLCEGALIEGGWQHRTLACSVMVAPAVTQAVEVFCVEQGRWGGVSGHGTPGRRAPLSVRAALAPASREQTRQHEVWRRVSRYEAQYGPSQTQSLVDVVDRTERDTQLLIHALSPLPGQVGVLLGIAGYPLLLEMFDSPRTLRGAWTALLSAASLDAMSAPPISTPAHRARRFVNEIEQLEVGPAAPVGAGAAGEGHGAEAAIRVLVWHERVVHAVATNLRHPFTLAA